MSRAAVILYNQLKQVHTTGFVHYNVLKRYDWQPPPVIDVAVLRWLCNRDNHSINTAMKSNVLTV